MFYLICLQIEMISFTILYRTFYTANFIVSKYMIFYIVFVLQVTTANGSREATITVYLLFEPASWSTPGKSKRHAKKSEVFMKTMDKYFVFFLKFFMYLFNKWILKLLFLFTI